MTDRNEITEKDRELAKQCLECQVCKTRKSDSRMELAGAGMGANTGPVGVVSGNGSGRRTDPD